MVHVPGFANHLKRNTKFFFQQGSSARPHLSSVPANAAESLGKGMYPGQEAYSAPASTWTCAVCTYEHAGAEAGFLACALCGTVRADDSGGGGGGGGGSVAGADGAFMREGGGAVSRSDRDEAGLASAATLFAAKQAVDSALAQRPDREAVVSSLLETSMAARIAQARQQRQAQRAAAAANEAARNKAKAPASADAEDASADAAEVAEPCLRCGLPVLAHERAPGVRRHPIHVACLTCTTCDKDLSQGEDLEMALNEQGEPSVYCRAHAEAMRISGHGKHPMPLASGAAASGGAGSLGGAPLEGGARTVAGAMATSDGAASLSVPSSGGSALQPPHSEEEYAP